MKNIFKILIAFISILAVSCSADDVDNRPVVTAVTVPELTAPTSGKEYVLEENNAANVAETFVWTAAEYDRDVVINYTVVIDKKGGDFSNPVTLATISNATETTVSVKTLNQAAIDLGAIPDQKIEFDVKIISDVSKGVQMISEAPITITVTAYTGELTYDFTDWYLIGAAVQGGWDNNVDTNHQPMFRDGIDSNKYSFTGYFMEGNFKLISEKGSWSSQLGRESDSTIQINDNAGEFTIPVSGYYKFMFDTETKTYSLEAFDASAVETFDSVGIIGSSTAGGWDTSTQLIKSEFNDHIWTSGARLLVDGEVKFRANDAWDNSWGGTTAFSGGGTGDNIPVQKSKYLIYFNDLDGSYLLIPNQE